MIFSFDLRLASFVLSGTKVSRRDGSNEDIPMIRLSLYKWFLLAAFGALQVADVITTKRVLDNGGWEANPSGFWG